MSREGGGSPPILVRINAELEPLIGGYLERRRLDVETLREALEKGDADAVASLGHVLKGSGGGFGFDRLTELGAGLEQAGSEGETQRAAALVDELADYLDRVEVEYT